jgi:hypothetical protein
VTYSATYALAGATIAQPPFIVFDAVNRKFTASTNNPADRGLYTLTVKASVPNPTVGPSATTLTSTSFTLKVGLDCDLSTMVDRTILDMQISLTQSLTQDI